jgi:putative acetyltransferase
VSNDLEIQTNLPNGFDEIKMLYGGAFPDEDLVPLVKNLVADKENVMSLAGVSGGKLFGHVVFTKCGIVARDGDLVARAALMGPVAVAAQRQGIGSALIHDGLDRLRADGIGRVFVLGDPGYYRRFEFQPDAQVAPPYPLPAGWTEAWQSRPLHVGGAPHRGVLSVPEPWQNPLLWQ